MTEKQRNDLLAEMTVDVAELVPLTQTQALSLALALAPGMPNVHKRFIRSLEQAGTLTARWRRCRMRRDRRARTASLGLTPAGAGRRAGLRRITGFATCPAEGPLLRLKWRTMSSGPRTGRDPRATCCRRYASMRAERWRAFDADPELLAMARGSPPFIRAGMADRSRALVSLPQAPLLPSSQ
jgi:hypothetical protein